MGLSDVIVDIVETGGTLKENHLSIIKVIKEVSARLIANRTSYRFKQNEITTLVGKLQGAGKAPQSFAGGVKGEKLRAFMPEQVRQNRHRGRRRSRQHSLMKSAPPV